MNIRDSALVIFTILFVIVVVRLGFDPSRGKTEYSRQDFVSLLAHGKSEHLVNRLRVRTGLSDAFGRSILLYNLPKTGTPTFTILDDNLTTALSELPLKEKVQLTSGLNATPIIEIAFIILGLFVILICRARTQTRLKELLH